jgi:hypothetical protein
MQMTYGIHYIYTERNCNFANGTPIRNPKNSIRWGIICFKINTMMSGIGHHLLLCKKIYYFPGSAFQNEELRMDFKTK